MVKTEVTEPKCYSERSTDNHCSRLNKGCYLTVDSRHTPCKLRSRADEACVACGRGQVPCRTAVLEGYCMLHAEQHGSSLSGCAA